MPPVTPSPSSLPVLKPMHEQSIMKGILFQHEVMNIIYLSTVQVIEPLQQLDHSALATPTWANQSNRLSNLNTQGESIQYLI